MAQKPKKQRAEAIFKAKRSLWSTPGVEGWRDYLGTVAPDTEWRRSDSQTIKALCPFHSEANPSFIIQLEKGRARCFGCNKHFHDPIKFLSELVQTPYKRMLDRVLKDFPQVPSILKEEAEEVHKRHEKDELKNILYRVFKECLADARAARSSKIKEKVDEFSYAEETLSWLDTRGIPEQNWYQLSIGIFPTEHHLEKYMIDFICRPDLVKDAKEYLAEMYSLTSVQWYGSLVLSFHSTPSQVSRFKLRKPDDKINTRSGQRVNFIREEDADTRGYFGLEACQGMRTEGLVVYVVEGEFDQMSLQLASLGAFNPEGELGAPHREIVVATGGSYHQSVDELYDTGFLEIRIVSDNPLHEGVKYVKELLRGTTVPFEIKVYTWPSVMASIKDPDKAVHMFDTVGPKMFMNSIYDDENFIESTLWCLKQIGDEILDKKKESDEQYKISLIRDYTGLVHADSTELFVRDACDKYDVDKAILTRNLVQNADEDTFIRELEKLILEEYVAVGTKTVSGLAYLTVWSRKNRERNDICTTRIRDSSGILALTTGSLQKWIYSKIGLPKFITEQESFDPSKPSKKLDLAAQTNKIDFYLAQALQNLSQTVPPMDHLLMKKEGIHVFKNKVEGSYKIYFNNAGKLFEGNYRAIEGEKYCIDWVELDKPNVEGKYFFEFDRFGWSVNKSITDLKLGEECDLRKLYNEVADIIDEGWSFENGGLDSKTLAAFILTCPIATVFQKRPAMFITAEKSSGKSKLALGLLAGQHGNIPCLIEHCMSSVNTSQAALYQEMDGKPMLYIADEFEEDVRGGMSEAKHTAIWNILRSASDGGLIKRGTPSGKPVRYHVSFPYILSAINLTSNAANLSRIIPIIMKHSNRHIDPGLALANRWSVTYFEDLSKKLTVATLSHVPGIMKRYEYLHAKYNSGESSGQLYASRFVEVMLPMLSLMNYIGVDEEDFLKKFTASKERFMEQLEHSDTDDIFSAILHSTYRFGSDINGNEPLQLHSILKSQVFRDALNRSNTGVCYYNKLAYLPKYQNWLVVHWPTVLNGILRSNSKYKDSNPTGLKEQSSRSSYIVPDKIYRAANAFRRVNGLEGEQFAPRNVSVYDVTEIVEGRYSEGEQPANNV